MFIVHVFVHVEKDYIENFKQATIENARKVYPTELVNHPL